MRKEKQNACDFVRWVNENTIDLSGYPHNMKGYYETLWEDYPDEYTLEDLYDIFLKES